MRTVLVLLGFLACSSMTTESIAVPSRVVGVSRVIGADGELVFPIACRVDRDNIFVLDRDLGRIVVFDRSGSFIEELGGDIDGGWIEVHDFALIPDGTIAVVDIGARRIVRIDRAGSLVDEHLLEYRPRTVGWGPRGSLITNTDASGSGSLLQTLPVASNTAEQFGDRISDPGAGPVVLSSHNRVRIFGGEGHVGVLHPFLSTLRILSWSGHETARTSILNESVRRSRDWYLGNSVNADAGRSRQLEAVESMEDLMRDTRALSTDGRFHGNFYVGEIVLHDGQVYALVGGEILVYDLALELQERIVIEGAGISIYPHRMSVSPDGAIHLLDSMHAGVVYEVE